MDFTDLEFVQQTISAQLSNEQELPLVFRTHHPILTRMFSAVSKYGHVGLHALANRDLRAAQDATHAMQMLFSWVTNSTPPEIDHRTSETYWKLIRQGVADETAWEGLSASTKKPAHRPVKRDAICSRFTAVLAKEEKILKGTSWPLLAEKYCGCKTAEGALRQQVRSLDKMLQELGV